MQNKGTKWMGMIGYSFIVAWIVLILLDVLGARLFWQEGRLIHLDSVHISPSFRALFFFRFRSSRARFIGDAHRRGESFFGHWDLLCFDQFVGWFYIGDIIRDVQRRDDKDFNLDLSCMVDSFYSFIAHLSFSIKVEYFYLSHSSVFICSIHYPSEED